MGLGPHRAAPTSRAALVVAAALAAILTACSGGPTPGGSCQSNQDCVAGETCIAGTCLAATNPGCTNDEQCPLGQYCDTEDSTCKMFSSTDPDAGVSPDPDAGDAGSSTVAMDGGTRPDSGTGLCTVDTDCGTPPRDICQAGQCVLGCAEAGGLMCTGGTVCDPATGHCVSENPSCQMDSECNPPTEICIGNQCVFGCGLDSTLCQAGEVCDTNTGRCVMVQTNCTDDSQCSPPMTVCESSQCVPGCEQPGGVQCSGQTPFCDSATGRCTNNNPNGCTLDADCTNPDEICVNMVCTLRCDAAGSPGCTAPEVCNTTSGRCVPGGLPLGDPCTQDAQCTTGYCLGLTINMMTMNVCSRPCGATSQCPLDFTCGDLGGMRFCLGENISNPPATFDTPAGGACNMTTNTCQSGWCNTGQSQCIETCSRNVDCTSFGGNCWTYEQTGTNGTTYDNLCYDPGSGSGPGVACTQNSNCRSGICNRYSGTCATHCCSDGDCGTTQNCQPYDLDASTIANICVIKSTTAGSLGLGATCTDAAQCDSEVCVPTNPAMMGSPSKCSTLCCQDSDCNQLPAGGRCRAAQGPVTGTIVGVCIPN